MDMKKLLNLMFSFLFLGILLFMYSCNQEKSSITGWNYNDEKLGGFEVHPYEGQETGPGLVLSRRRNIYYGFC